MTTLDTMPTEVLHTLCRLLSPKDVAALRSTCNVLAEVGAHYLTRRVRFHTSQASIARLQAFADHEVIGQYVETVHFEANLLPNICCREYFREQFQKPAHGPRDPELEMPKEPKSPLTVRENRLHARNVKKWQELIDKKYDQFRQLYEEQQELHQHGPELMAETMPCFPRLKNIILTIGRCPHVLSSRFVEEFNGRLGYCVSLSIDSAPTGNQLKHIIAPAGIPLSNLQTLIVSDLDPSLFMSTETSSIIKQAFINLKKLDISFRLPNRDGPDNASRVYKDFKKGSLRDAICSAVDLEELRLSFNDYTYDGPCVQIRNILGEHAFDHLHKLNLSYVEAGAQEFVETLKQQKKLTSLSISCVTIKGSWVSVLDDLQKELKLDWAFFDGLLFDDDEMYDTDQGEIEYYMDCRDMFTLSTAMELFVTGTDGDHRNPLRIYGSGYADAETLTEMWHEMMAGMGDEDDCDCDECIAELEALDDSMPDLEDYQSD